MIVLNPYPDIRPHSTIHVNENDLQSFWQHNLTGVVFRACLKIILFEFHKRFRIIWQLAHNIQASALVAVFS